MKRLVLAIAAAAALATPVHADETWTSAVGLIEWEREAGDAAVFKFDTPGHTGVTRLFVPGLVADTMGGRDTYSGYWTDDSGRATCAAELTDPLGTRTRSWGRFEITFVKEAFPSDWTGRLGDCFETPTRRLNGLTTAD